MFGPPYSSAAQRRNGAKIYNIILPTNIHFGSTMPQISSLAKYVSSNGRGCGVMQSKVDNDVGSRRRKRNANPQQKLSRGPRLNLWLDGAVRYVLSLRRGHVPGVLQLPVVLGRGRELVRHLVHPCMPAQVQGKHAPKSKRVSTTMYRVENSCEQPMSSAFSLLEWKSRVGQYGAMYKCQWTHQGVVQD